MADMLYAIILFIHIVVSIILVLSVLMQASKGGGLAGTFGGSGMTGGVFGGRGAAPLLVRITTVCAVLFFVTSLSLNFVTRRGTDESILERSLRESGGSAPAVMDEMPMTAPDRQQAPAESDGPAGGTSTPETE